MYFSYVQGRCVVVLHGLCVVSLIMFLVFVVSQLCVYDLCSCYVLSCVVYKSLIRRGSKKRPNGIKLLGGIVLAAIDSHRCT